VQKSKKVLYKLSELHVTLKPEKYYFNNTTPLLHHQSASQDFPVSTLIPGPTYLTFYWGSPRNNVFTQATLNPTVGGGNGNYRYTCHLLCSGCFQRTLPSLPLSMHNAATHTTPQVEMQQYQQW